MAVSAAAGPESQPGTRTWSTRDAAGLTGVEAALVRRWARAGIVTPARDARGRWRYSFADLALLRAGAGLIRCRLTPHRVTRALRLVREQLPTAQPLSAVRIFVAGRRVVVTDGCASWEPESRQRTLGFDAEPRAPRVPPSRRARSRAGVQASRRMRSYSVPAPTPRPRQRALDLEPAARAVAAVGGPRVRGSVHGTRVDARIELGYRLHAADRVAEAEALYRVALEEDPGNAEAAYHLGRALEDQHEDAAAVAAYRRAVVLDAAHADAHFNLARLLETRGDAAEADRHLQAFRRFAHADA